MLAGGAVFFSADAVDAMTTGELLSFDLGDEGRQKAEEVVTRRRVRTRPQYM